MHLNVPFFQQTNSLNCGPTALRMVCSFFGHDWSEKFVEDTCGIKEGKGIFTLHIAIAAAKLGLGTEFLSKQLVFDQNHMTMAFYQQYSDMNVQASVRLLEEAKHLGVVLEEKTLSLEELLARLNHDTVAIVLVNWNTILGKEGYQGHFVPIVGFDEHHVVIHNQSHTHPEAFVSIEKSLFDRARKSNGTDEDVVFLTRKKNAQRFTYER